MVPVRAGPVVFGSTVNGTVVNPVPDAEPAILIQLALVLAVHEQDDVVETTKESEAPAAG
jgi:hypothetical protein